MIDYNALLYIYKAESDEAIKGGAAPLGLNNINIANFIEDHFWCTATSDADDVPACEWGDAIMHAAALQCYAPILAKAKGWTIIHVNSEAKTLFIEGAGTFEFPAGFPPSTQAFFESLQMIHGECLFL